MPDFNTADLKIWSRQGSWSWDQQKVDTITAYLFTRGWRPPINVGMPRYISARAMNAKHVPNPPDTVEIDRARFKEPLTNVFKGADKALKAALKTETYNNVLKETVLKAQEALQKNELNVLQDLLNKIQTIAGG